MNGLSLPSFLDERLHSRKPAFFENFFETLLIIAFCSFAIGLYWRFKFRSCYWAVAAIPQHTEQEEALLPVVTTLSPPRGSWRGATAALPLRAGGAGRGPNYKKK